MKIDKIFNINSVQNTDGKKTFSYVPKLSYPNDTVELSGKAKKDVSFKGFLNGIKTEFIDKEKQIAKSKTPSAKDIKKLCDELNDITVEYTGIKGMEYLMQGTSSEAVLDKISNSLFELKAGFSKCYFKDIFRIYDSKLRNLVKNNKMPKCYIKNIDMYKRMFDDILSIMDTNPMKSDEADVEYFDRVRNIYDEEQDLKQEKLNSKIDALDFDKNDETCFEEEKVYLTDEEKHALVDKIKSDSSFNEGISYDSSMEEIANAWRKSYMGEQGPDFNEKESQACLQNLKRYKTETKKPLTRWMVMDNDKLQKYISSIPKENEEFVFNRYQSFSKDGFQAETIFKDDNPDMNVKIIVYPKGKVSQSYDMENGRFGNQEVVFPKGSRFKVIHKDFEEYKGNLRIKKSFPRYCVYLQEE